MVSGWLQLETVSEKWGSPKHWKPLKALKGTSLQKNRTPPTRSHKSVHACLSAIHCWLRFISLYWRETVLTSYHQPQGRPASTVPRACVLLCFSHTRFFLFVCHTPLSLSPEQWLHLSQVPELNLILSYNCPEKKTKSFGVISSRLRSLSHPPAPAHQSQACQVLSCLNVSREVI